MVRNFNIKQVSKLDLQNIPEKSVREITLAERIFEVPCMWRKYYKLINYLYNISVSHTPCNVSDGFSMRLHASAEIRLFSRASS